MADAPNATGQVSEPVYLVDSSGNKITSLNPLPVTGGGGGGGGAAGGTSTATNPTYTEGSTNQPISLDLSGRLRIRLADGSGTDRSITATTTSQQLMASNTARVAFVIKNDTTIDVWINVGATAVATAGSGNFKVAANGGYYSPDGCVPTGAINIIATSGTPAITAREY